MTWRMVDGWCEKQHWRVDFTTSNRKLDGLTTLRFGLHVGFRTTVDHISIKMFNYNLHLWAFGRFFFGWLNQGLLRFVFIPTSDSVKVLKCPLPRCWTLFFIFLDKLCSWNFCLTCSQDWNGRKLLETILTGCQMTWNDLQLTPSRREMLHRMDIWPDMDVWCLSANDQNISDWHSRTAPYIFCPRSRAIQGRANPGNFTFGYILTLAILKLQNFLIPK